MPTKPNIAVKKNGLIKSGRAYLKQSKVGLPPSSENSAILKRKPK
ncbi:hypothetical protein LEP1GSC043_3673 [Leptospira weilii str. Ecochallenge]|uniref:Uncharacterized protein n=2 Tax=Leptospira weilii TaxID=28184 RepID=N1U298_9LEPT|nr:hypothetical protein LEP1GSC051_1362 [Leptospira sp. P2653]EMN90830.1 hypothetical protein LEP1GSC108_2280 [Leptospira weilii str. UI 13098]EMY12266.1 hypothetical protein LEP1GSC043_3673 [Leptospira weilii str. Ecochallenge]